MSRCDRACAYSRQVLIAWMDTPGPGTEAPSRKMAIMARGNSSLRRRSGVRNAAANACSTCPPLVGRLRLATGPPREAGRAREGPSAGPAASLRVVGGQRGPLSDAGGAAPGRADLLGCRRGESVRLHVDLHATEVAGA